MSTRQSTCHVAVCDVCGTSETTDGSTPHGSSPQEAIDIVTERWGDPTLGWVVTVDGRLVCDTEDDAEHKAAHEEAGRGVSGDAMVATFA